VYTDRYYRTWVSNKKLFRFIVLLHESDIEIATDSDLTERACRALFDIRKNIEDYIVLNPQFAPAMKPVAHDDNAPCIVRKMMRVSGIWDVGPMASVAGAIAEAVGESISALTDTVIVENGGDTFVRADHTIDFALYAGEESPFSGHFGFSVDAPGGMGICTSSGIVGHSFSDGRANAVTVIAESCAFADAAATAIANRIKFPDDVDQELETFARVGRGLSGIIACCGERFAVWGVNIFRIDMGKDV